MDRQDTNGGHEIRSDQAGEMTPTRIDDSLCDRRDARLSRVLDFQASSLAKDDPLEANLGSINSGLMRVALWLDEAIEEAMESGPRTVERLQRMLPAIETHLRVTRQVDRFAQLEIRNAEARKPKPTVDDRDTVCLDAPSNASIGESEDSEV